MRRLYLFAIVALLALAACGDDDDTDNEATDTSETTSASETTAPSAGDDDSATGGDDDDSATGGGGDPTGTATVDGTEYTIVASLQCLVALDEANQISLSGEVEEYESEDQVQWSYSWDSDDDVNDFSITVSDELEYTTFNLPEWDAPQVDGRSVSASGMVFPSAGGDPVEASFEIDCAG